MATTIGIVESVITEIPDLNRFIEVCRKKSVFSDTELAEHWNYNKQSRPFVVNFLYLHSLKKRPNLNWLHKAGIIPDINDMPRGFRQISWDDLHKIAKYQKGA